MTLDARSVAVVAIALAGCACDLRSRRLPNALTLGAAGAAFAFALSQNGLTGLGLSGAGWLVAVALFFPFFALGGLGAGDVKLLGALGAWLGVTGSLHLALYTALAGGGMALAVIVARRYTGQALRNLWLLFAFWRTAGLRPHPELTLQGSRGPKLAYALPIAAGALTVLWLQ